MDCQMPEMDGLEATRNIRSMDSDKALIPIIAVTANATSTDRTRCIEAGMNDYLSKPLNRQELLQKLVQWLPLEGHEKPDGDSTDSTGSSSNVTPIAPRYQ
jgi:CheY-like chemotaxis protein